MLALALTLLLLALPLSALTLTLLRPWSLSPPGRSSLQGDPNPNPNPNPGRSSLQGDAALVAQSGQFLTPSPSHICSPDFSSSPVIV